MIDFELLDTLEIKDLIGIPYKENGRDLTGLDCYGNGIFAVYILSKKKLRDVIYENHNIELADENAPLLNIRKTDFINKGTLLEIHAGNELHIGVALNKKEFIHATYNHGVKISPIGAYTVVNKYEVI